MRSKRTICTLAAVVAAALVPASAAHAKPGSPSTATTHQERANVGTAPRADTGDTQSSAMLGAGVTILLTLIGCGGQNDDPGHAGVTAETGTEPTDDTAGDGTDPGGSGNQPNGNQTGGSNPGGSGG